MNITVNLRQNSLEEIETIFNTLSHAQFTRQTFDENHDADVLNGLTYEEARESDSFERRVMGYDLLDDCE